MRKHIWELLKMAFLGGKDLTQVKHDPQLTQFLKNNPQFRKMAWKIHHFKNKSVDSLDEKLIQDQKDKQMEEKRKGPQSKGFNVGKNKDDD